MALSNPINFFKTDEKNALLNKNKALNKITTTSVTFVEKPNNKTKDNIEANGATGDGAIFIEGKKVIQGVSVLEKQYLLDQLSATEVAKYSAKSISVTPTSNTWGFDTSAKDITFIFEARYNGVGTDKVTTQIIGDSAGSAVIGKTGQYSKVINCPASNTGRQSISTLFKFTYTDTGYDDAEKDASASWTRTAYSVVINTTKGEKPTEDKIKNASVKLKGINSLKEYQTEANKDMWVCTPSYDTWKNMSSDGYPVPFDETVTVVKVNNIVNYNCRRKSSIPEGALIKKIVITN